MKAFLFYSFVLFFCFNSQAQQPDVESIKQLMHKQETAWNNGDIESFMQGYLKSDSLLFVGNKGASWGWDSTLQHYRNAYPDKASMGQLHFNIIELRRLSADYYFVLGKWHLTRTIGDAGGFYTLLFKKIKTRWYIVADHSS